MTLPLVGLLVWRIDFRDKVYLAGGGHVTGRIVSPDKRDPLIDERTGEILLTEIVMAVDGGAALKRIPRADLPADPDDLRRAIRFGFLTSIRGINPLWGAVGLLLIGLYTPVTGYRWQVLLRVQGVHLGFWTCVKLTTVGFFFDNVMPGSTGGDLVKAYYVARRTHHTAEAAISVFVDRFVGLFALGLLSGGVVLFSLRRPEFAKPAWVVGAFLGAVCVAALVFYSRRVRRLVRLDTILGRLPFQRIVKRCDEAVFLYRHHKAAVVWASGLSVLMQLVGVCGMYALGRSIDLGPPGGILGLYSYLVYVPVLMMVSAIPVSPGGLGWREGAFAIFFGYSGVPSGMGLALAVLYRGTRIVWGLPGVLFLWGRRRVSTAEMERELAESVEAGIDGQTA